ncbi:EAL domain-containing protein [Vibrio mimicus]|uniref:EAL domain-containing protein n=1 Tax=Vibrio mimicus TaxID=674 RepID=UPI000877F8BC|nr:EAL domain-containing protein [Vibrio mimicus]AOW83980.1 diguanylate phosphodiesterase [Vibrio mimicus]
MIVEDDRIQATSLKLKLRHLGLDEVILAENGFAALELCNKVGIDLIFCDIRMPQMDGISLLSQLGEHFPKLGVIILSAVDDAILELTRNMCSLAGFPFVDSLSKPYQMEELQRVIERFQEQARPEISFKQPIVLTSEEVEQAFIHDHIFNYYQPQFDFRSGAIVGVEALVRYEHPTYGMLSPAVFLPLIEQCGLHEKLFLTVLEKAVSALASIDADLQLSVNISQCNLQQSICDPILAICDKHGFAASKLTLEMTEHEVYNGTTTSLANLARLRMYGVGLSIDDFGTGYASLGQLAKLPFTELKIDRSFVHDLATNYKHQQLTNMCLLLAQSLGLHCVVEGVENEETWQYLRNLGVDTCQGYYAAKPMPIVQLSELYTKNRRQCLDCQSTDDGWQILMADSQVLSANALQKLMQKENKVSKVFVAQDIEQTLHKLRDLPINLVVVESRFLSGMSVDAFRDLLAPYYQGLVIVLQDGLVPSLHSQECHSVVWKANTLSETANRILTQAEQYSAQASCAMQHNELAQLSERELLVANMLVEGLTNKQIAQQLDINQKTVSTYKARIMNKLGIKSAMELVRFITLK